MQGTLTINTKRKKTLVRISWAKIKTVFHDNLK